MRLSQKTRSFTGGESGLGGSPDLKANWTGRRMNLLLEKKIGRADENLAVAALIVDENSAATGGNRTLLTYGEIGGNRTQALKPLQIFTIVASQADLEVYWKSKLPNSRMPKAVRDLLHNEWSEDNVRGFAVNHAASQAFNINYGFRGSKIKYAASQDLLHYDPNVASAEAYSIPSAES